MNLMGSTYRCASGSRVSSAPKSNNSCLSKKITASQVRPASSAVPNTAAENSSLERRSLPEDSPRSVLNSTDPPMPMSRPRL